MRESVRVTDWLRTIDATKKEENYWWKNILVNRNKKTSLLLATVYYLVMSARLLDVKQSFENV